MTDNLTRWPKPSVLLSCHELCPEVFALIHEAFEVGPTYVLRFDSVDCVEAELRDITAVAALALRKVQALRYASAPGVFTTNDVVIGLAAELHRALTELARAEVDHRSTLLRYRDLIADAARSVAGIGGIVALE